jgi:hypothetical protein
MMRRIMVHDEKSELMPEMVSISDLKGHRLTFGDMQSPKTNGSMAAMPPLPAHVLRPGSA